MQAAAQNIPASPVFDTQTAIASPSQGVTSFTPVRTTLATPRQTDHAQSVRSKVSGAGRDCDRGHCVGCGNNHALHVHLYELPRGKPVAWLTPFAGKTLWSQLLYVRWSITGERMDAPENTKWKVVDGASDCCDRRSRVSRGTQRPDDASSRQSVEPGKAGTGTRGSVSSRESEPAPVQPLHNSKADTQT